MKNDYKETTGDVGKKGAGATGNTRLKFDNKPSIWPTDEASKKNPALEEGKLFSKNALGSEIPTTDDYAAGSKKEYFKKDTFDHKMPNTLWPTENY